MQKKSEKTKPTNYVGLLSLCFHFNQLGPLAQTSICSKQSGMEEVFCVYTLDTLDNVDLHLLTEV